MAPEGEPDRRNVGVMVRAAAAVVLMAVPAAAYFLSVNPIEEAVLYAGSGLLAVVGGMLLPGKRSSLWKRLLFAILMTASFFWAGSYLQRIRPYPFSLTWSEGNHLWDAALFYLASTGVPSSEIPISNYVTPGLYGLRGLPFLFGHASITIYRAWEAVLWLAPPVFFSWVVSRLSRMRGWWAGLFCLWGALFLAQGPVYAPLLLGGAVSLLAVRDPRQGVQRMGMLTGTLLAGLARWTWMFTPGLWGIVALGFRTRQEADRRTPDWAALTRDAFVVLLGAALSQLLSYLITGHAPLTYFSTLSHPLLWYRLLPNETYSPGILKGLALTTGPLTAALGIALWKMWDRHNFWEAGLTMLLTAGLGVAGFVISVKIGGGSNLHNLDMFLATLVLLTGLWAASIVREFAPGWPRTLVQVVIVVLVAIPVAQVAGKVNRLALPDATASEEALALIEGLLENATVEDEVLFIDQRQLLVFGDYPSLHWDPAFEQVELMDRALAMDEDYLSTFYAQLQTQRYRWIICDPQPVVFKGRSGPFGEENDAWVNAVTIPLLEAYQPRYRLDDVGIWILEPRNEVAPDGTD